MNKKPLELDHQIYLIDGFDLGLPSRTGTYVLNEATLTLVETGPSMSVPYILKGLKELNLDPNDVKYIIVTHIHLDHAGGAGLLLQKCPNAKVVVHPKGARHLVDPSRLILGAKAVYGDDFERLFEPIVPIPEEKLIVVEDGQQFILSDSRTLTFYDTKGHADHHISIHDSLTNGIFTGDTIGIRYDQIKEFEFFLPSTSPNQFKPDEMIKSLQKIVHELKVSTIFFGHFSATTQVEEVEKQILFWLSKFVEKGELVFRQNGDYQELSSILLEDISGYLKDRNVPSGHHVFELIHLDLQVCAMGILDYLEKKNK